MNSRRFIKPFIIVLIPAVLISLFYWSYITSPTDTPPNRKESDFLNLINRTYPVMARDGSIYSLKSVDHIDKKWYIFTLKSKQNEDLVHGLIQDTTNGPQGMKIVIAPSVNHSILDIPDEFHVPSQIIDKLIEKDTDEK